MAGPVGPLYLNTPNFSFMLPWLAYDGPEPDASLQRNAVIDLFRDYAKRNTVPVRMGTEATRITRRAATAAWIARPQSGFRPSPAVGRVPVRCGQ